MGVPAAVGADTVCATVAKILVGAEDDIGCLGQTCEGRGKDEYALDEGLHIGQMYAWPIVWKVQEKELWYVVMCL